MNYELLWVFALTHGPLVIVLGVLIGMVVSDLIDLHSTKREQ